MWIRVESVWLADHGFEVTAMDVSPVALAKAKSAAGDRADRINWISLDILNDELPENQFDFIFDRGFFHVFNSKADREMVARKLASSLEKKWNMVNKNGK